MKKLGILISLCMLLSLLCGNALAVEAVECYSIRPVHDGDSFAIDEDVLIQINFSAEKQPDGWYHDYTLQVNDGAEISGDIYNFQGMYLVTRYHDAYLFVYAWGDDDSDMYDIYHIAREYNDSYEYEYKLYPVGLLDCYSSPEQIRVNLDGSLTVLARNDILSSPTYSESKVMFIEDMDYGGMLEYKYSWDKYFSDEETDEEADLEDEYQDYEDDSEDRLHGIYWLPDQARPLADVAVACATEEFALYADPNEASEIAYTVQPGTLVAILGYCDDWAYISKYEEDFNEICSGWLPLDPQLSWGYFMLDGESHEIDDYLYGLHRGG